MIDRHFIQIFLDKNKLLHIYLHLHTSFAFIALLLVYSTYFGCFAGEKDYGNFTKNTKNWVFRKLLLQ